MAWSVDNRLVYNVTQREGSYQIYANNLNGTDERRLTASGLDEWSAEWSPDGGTLLFLTERDGGSTNSAIYRMNADGSNQRPLHDSSSYEWSPSWSADGAQVLFSRSAAGRNTDRDDIYIINADGSGARLVAEHASYPSWAAPLR